MSINIPQMGPVSQSHMYLYIFALLTSRTRLIKDKHRRKEKILFWKDDVYFSIACYERNRKSRREIERGKQQPGKYNELLYYHFLFTRLTDL